MAATVIVEPRRRLAASMFGSYPSSSTTAITRARIATLTSGCPERTRETDDIATPARSATSRRLRLGGPLTSFRSAPEWRPQPAQIHVDPQPGAGGRRPAPTRRAGLVPRDMLVRPVVHERHREERTCPRARRKMRDGSRYEIAAPGVLDRDREAERVGEVAHLAGFGETADLRDLEIERFHRPCLVGAHERGDVGDALVENEGEGRALAHVAACLERRARLLHVDAVEAGQHPDGGHALLRRVAAVRVGDDDVVVAAPGEHRADAVG